MLPIKRAYASPDGPGFRLNQSCESFECEPPMVKQRLNIPSLTRGEVLNLYRDSGMHDQVAQNYIEQQDINSFTSYMSENSGKFNGFQVEYTFFLLVNDPENWTQNKVFFDVLIQSGIEPNAPLSSSGTSMLMEAASRLNYDAARTLVKYGASTSFETRDGKTLNDCFFSPEHAKDFISLINIRQDDVFQMFLSMRNNNTL
jgi:ankyrin repeat protein